MSGTSYVSRAVVMTAFCVSLSAGLPLALAQHTPTAEVLQELRTSLEQLQRRVAELRRHPQAATRDGRAGWADVAIFEKAVLWLLKHDEFYKPEYVEQTRRVLELGMQRADQLSVGFAAAAPAESAEWFLREGSTIRGFISRVDRSIQPYALTLPAGVDPKSSVRWPLHVVLHGRANEMNEVNFIHRTEGKKAGDPIEWIQLDVYGRGSNAYRWAGETDVFEAIDDVKRRFRIDENRVTLHGFSMGGAGAWHLGLHYPHLWSSVGPGAGFVDFYKYQNHKEQLPIWQHQTLGIYDAVDYALNAANVPVCTYGGELDPQLAASTTMAEAAAALNVPIKVIVGPGMGHKFDPASREQFMAFHLEKSAAGRPNQNQRRRIRFTTRTLRYNQCDWLIIEEIGEVYTPATVEAEVNADGDVEILTENVTALRVSRDIAGDAIIDGDVLPCRSAADGLLPDVCYRLTDDGWEVLGYDESRSFADNPDRVKRHGLQGPVDDAFMDAFVCVRGTGSPWHAASQEWSQAILTRFVSEFDKWMRGEPQVVDDSAVDQELIAENHLILFGDPSSNEVLRRVLPDLPIHWTREKITVGDRSWDTATHGISLIFPNPLNPRRYVVINSGHTVHDHDFRASNAWLFPRLGDIAIRRLTAEPSADAAERKSSVMDYEIVWAANFDASWRLAPQQP